MIKLQGEYNKDCVIFSDNVEDEALSLIQRILDNPVSKGVPVRIMPDVHAGVDIVIGFTMPVTDRINPNHIGVDIGCGMLSIRIPESSSFSDLSLIDENIQSCIPMGTNLYEFVNPNDADILFYLINNNLCNKLSTHLEHFGSNDYKVPIVDRRYISSLCDRIGISEATFYNSIGTLGGGNHFIEIGKRGDNSHWLTIHTGSRNFGLKVCKYHCKKAKLGRTKESKYQEEFKRIIERTTDKTLIPPLLKKLDESYPKGKNELFGTDMLDYLVDMCIAQSYAEYNRYSIARTIFRKCGWEFIGAYIETIHNYIDFDDCMIRKGAISAHKDKYMVIPMNMRDGILLCKGKDNKQWNCSAPHGAGRLFSRSKAKEVITMDEFSQSMKDVYSSCICESTLDESPMAYKDMNVILKAITPTVDIIDRIVPILNIKAK